MGPQLVLKRAETGISLVRSNFWMIIYKLFNYFCKLYVPILSILKVPWTQTAKQSDNAPLTLATRRWNWRKSSTSTATWLVDEELRLLTPSASPSDKSRSGSRTGEWSGKRSTKWHRWTLFLIICREYFKTFTLNQLMLIHIDLL